MYLIHSEILWNQRAVSQQGHEISQREREDNTREEIAAVGSRGEVRVCGGGERGLIPKNFVSRRTGIREDLLWWLGLDSENLLSTLIDSTSSPPIENSSWPSIPSLIPDPVPVLDLVLSSSS
jgi:hypothetical protein